MSKSENGIGCFPLTHHLGVTLVWIKPGHKTPGFETQTDGASFLGGAGPGFGGHLHPLRHPGGGFGLRGRQGLPRVRPGDGCSDVRTSIPRRCRRGSFFFGVCVCFWLFSLFFFFFLFVCYVPFSFPFFCFFLFCLFFLSIFFAERGDCQGEDSGLPDFRDFRFLPSPSPPPPRLAFCFPRISSPFLLFVFCFLGFPWFSTSQARPIIFAAVQLPAQFFGSHVQFIRRGAIFSWKARGSREVCPRKAGEEICIFGCQKPMVRT